MMSNSKEINIAKRAVGLGHSPFIIAEMSGNHNQSLDRALEIVEAAAKCRFRNCMHIQEPGCAVRDVLESGGLSGLRYQSYLRIRESMFEDQQVALSREKADKRSRPGEG